MRKVDGQCEVSLRWRNHLTYRNPAAFPEVRVQSPTIWVISKPPALPSTECELYELNSISAGAVHLSQVQLIHYCTIEINGWRLERWTDMCRWWVQMKQPLWKTSRQMPMNSAHRQPIQILWDRVCWCTLKECLNCTLGIENRFILKTITEMTAMMFGSRT